MAGAPLAPTLTSIVATVGPASRTPRDVGRLIEGGASVFRLNFSHGTQAAHGEHVRAVREAARAAGRTVALLGDLQGPKIRVEGAGDGVAAATGATVVFRRGTPVPQAGAIVLSATSDALFGEVEPGHRVLVDDGSIRMLVVEKHQGAIVCTVTHGGTIRPAKGINLPDSDLAGPPLTDRDRAWVDWAVAQEIDFLGLSFVGGAGDVEELRGLVERAARAQGRATLRPHIVAKIERPRAVERIDAIADAADAIMIARGDLGVEMDPAEVPVVQKRLIAAAHRAGKPCIVATQMLQSMIESPAPTRAEASDVANAIFDRVDAVMLSGETAVGRYPDLAVQTMRRIAERAERHLREQPPLEAPPAKPLAARHGTAALAHGAWTVARDFGARLIVVWSQEGGGARYLSRNHFQIPVVAVSTDERALRHMTLLRGVQPVHMTRPENLADFTRRVDEFLLRSGWARAGDPVILMAGGPVGTPRATNSLALHHVGDPAGGYRKHGG